MEAVQRFQTEKKRMTLSECLVWGKLPRRPTVCFGPFTSICCLISDSPDHLHAPSLSRQKTQSVQADR